MKTIVLITRENNERITHVAVYLCGNYSEAGQFCRFMNRLSLEGGEKLVARVAVMNREYPLEKYIPFTFDDIVRIDDRTIQKIMRELDTDTIATALKTAKNEVKDKFFMNMSMRAGAMLREDMEYMDPFTEEEIEDSRQLILDIYHSLTAERFSEATAAYQKVRAEKTAEPGDNLDIVDGDAHVMLVFHGCGGITRTVSVSLFNAYEDAEIFGNYLNDLKLDKNFFINAVHAEKMVEYETTKPMLTRFDEVLKYREFVNEYQGTEVIRYTLGKFSVKTLVQAFMGLDKRSRESFLQILPFKTVDEINEIIKDYDNRGAYLPTLSEIRKAREKIIHAVSRNAQKFLDGVLTGHKSEMLVD